MGARKGNPGFHESRSKTALQRFAEKCQFDAATGCVLWTGGTSSGRGNSARYGVFWHEGRWFAHRWAAMHIHGIELGSFQVGHCCPCGPNTLCVEHVEGQTQIENLEEQHGRRRLAQQSAVERQHWLFVQLGIHEPEPEAPQQTDGIPYHEPPAWLRPYLQPKEANDDCPF